MLVHLYVQRGKLAIPHVGFVHSHKRGLFCQYSTTCSSDTFEEWREKMYEKRWA